MRLFISSYLILSIFYISATYQLQIDPFNCKRWSFKDKIYQLSDLDHVFTSHSATLDARVSLCQPLSLDQLASPGADSCPVGSHVCIWKEVDGKRSIVAAFGAVSYASINSKGDVILYFFDGLKPSNNTSNIFPLIGRVALIYTEGEKSAYMYGPDLDGSCLDFRLFSEKLKPYGDGHGNDQREWGFFSWFFFFSFLILVCYFIFGYIYKSSVLGLSGLEAIPHPEFWSSIIEQGAENITRLWKSIVHRDSDGRGAYEQI